MCVGIGCYPEKHAFSNNFDEEINLLKQKINLKTLRHKCFLKIKKLNFRKMVLNIIIKFINMNTLKIFLPLVFYILILEIANT